MPWSRLPGMGVSDRSNAQMPSWWRWPAHRRPRSCDPGSRSDNSRPMPPPCCATNVDNTRREGSGCGGVHPACGDCPVTCPTSSASPCEQRWTPMIRPIPRAHHSSNVAGPSNASPMRLGPSQPPCWMADWRRPLVASPVPTSPSSSLLPPCRPTCHGQVRPTQITRRRLPLQTTPAGRTCLQVNLRGVGRSHPKGCDGSGATHPCPGSSRRRHHRSWTLVAPLGTGPVRNDARSTPATAAAAAPTAPDRSHGQPSITWCGGATTVSRPWTTGWRCATTATAWCMTRAGPHPSRSRRAGSPGGLPTARWSSLSPGTTRSQPRSQDSQCERRTEPHPRAAPSCPEDRDHPPSQLAPPSLHIPPSHHARTSLHLRKSLRVRTRRHVASEHAPPVPRLASRDLGNRPCVESPDQ